MKVKLTNLQSVAFDHSAISSIIYRLLIKLEIKKIKQFSHRKKKIARKNLQMEELKKNKKNNKE